MAKKRANGEGNIRKRADGRWEGRYTAGYRCLKELAHTAGFPLKSVGGREQVSLSSALSSRPVCQHRVKGCVDRSASLSITS